MKKVMSVLLLICAVSCAPRISEKCGGGIIAGTFRWDIAKNMNGPTGDIFLGHQTAKERYLEPVDRAGIAVLPGVSFESVKLADLHQVQFGQDRIVDTDDSPVMNKGVVIALRTANNNYAKIEIIGWTTLHDLNFNGSEIMKAETKEWILAQPDMGKYNLKIRWTLFESSR